MPEGVGLDARVDVLGDEDGALAGFMQVVGDGDDAVVGRVFAEGVGALVGVDVDAYGAGGAGGRADDAPGHAVDQAPGGAEFVEVADGLARGAAEVVVGAGRRWSP
jgi:hypothetical protein